LPARLSRFVDEYGAESGASATFALSGEPRPLPADADLAVQRVAQESLTNVRRHAAGASVRARLHFGPGEIVLTVSDSDARPGTGVTRAGGGHGIAGMRERAELLGGRLDAGPAAGGWSVELRIPA
jgi:signal transduction histidine kinase